MVRLLDTLTGIVKTNGVLLGTPPDGGVTVHCGKLAWVVLQLML